MAVDRSRTATPSSAESNSQARTRRARDRANGEQSGREETRQALLDAASRLFAQQGYQATTVPQIVQAAGVGHGTFYQYFGSRRAILVAITEEAAKAHTRRPEVEPRSLAEQIRVEIYWYLIAYVEHLDLSKVWHVAANFDPEIEATVRELRALRLKQVKEAFMGVIAPTLDPGVAAAAVIAMLEEFAYRWFVEGAGPGSSARDVVAASETLTAMSLAALGIEPIGARGTPPARPFH